MKKMVTIPQKKWTKLILLLGKMEDLLQEMDDILGEAETTW